MNGFAGALRNIALKGGAFFASCPGAACLAVLFILTLLWGRFFLADIVIGGTPDMACAFTKVAGLVQSWHDGFILGRWTIHLNFGYGYPLLNTYPPLFYYLAGAVGALLGNIAWGVNLTVLGTGFLSVVAMYFFVRRWWGVPAAFFASAAYLFAPYRSLDIYHRGGCAEFTVFFFLPFLLLSMDRFLDKPRVLSFLGVVFSMAGLVLAHNLMAMLILPVAFFYLIFRSALHPDKWFNKACAVALALFYGCLLATYFWLPALLEIKFTNASKLVTGFADYTKHFMSLKQIFLAQGLAEPYHGGALWTVLMVVGILLLPFLFRKERNSGWMYVFWTALSAACIFMMTAGSAPVWTTLKPLAFVQFPWRFFLFLSFTSSFLAGSIIWFLPGKLRWYAAVAGVLLVLGCHYRYAYPEGGTYREDTRDLKAWLYTHRPMDSMDGLPRQVQVISRNAPERMVNVVLGNAELTGVPSRPEARYSFTARAATRSLVMIYHYYFPGWTVLVDGKRVDIFSDNPLGVITFFVPEGEHRVEVFFGHTPVRWAGEFVSILAILGLVLLWIRRREVEGKLLRLFSSTGC